MKTMKKVLSLVMVLALVMSFTVVAFADEGKGTVANESGASYKYYQIFAAESWAADEEGETSGALGQLTWGSALATADEQAAFVAALAGLIEVEDATDAQAVAAAISKASDKAAEIAAAVRNFFAGKPETGTVASANNADLPYGYYAFLATSANTNTGVWNEALLLVEGNMTITDKTDAPSSDKWVKDKNDTNGTGYENVTDENPDGWVKSADWDVNDEVPYQLHGHIQNKGYDAYTSYEVTFVDTMSEGLTFNKSSVTAYYINEQGQKVAIELSEDDIVVEAATDPNYPNGTKVTFKLGDVKALGAPAGADIYVEYTATLNDKAVIGNPGNPNEMHMEFSNNPYDSNEKGTTPDDKARVFTYEITGDKVDGEGKGLDGAEFTLYKKVTADYPGASQLIEGDDNYYVQVGDVEVPVKDETTGKYNFGWKGLDDGTYVLVETKVPTGYNKAANTEIVISAAHDANETTVTVTGATPTEKGAHATVTNLKGVTLPETGGIGTTIFYVVGAILVAGAAILLVTKRRMNGAVD